jgi:hypothetical protein
MWAGGQRTAPYKAPPPKKAVFSLAERDGKARSFHIANVTAETVRPLIVTVTSRKSHLRTDESGIYWKVGEEFATHRTVNHSAEEYVRGDAHTNTAEGMFSILKRGIYGIYQHASEAHLQRYLHEFDFRYNNRVALGIDDVERATRAIQGAAGKRLTYRQPRSQAQASGAA